MKNIIVSIAWSHNSTVGISIDGEIKCLLSEERLNRVKNCYDFPILAFNFIVKKYLNSDKSLITKLVLTDLSSTNILVNIKLISEIYKPASAIFSKNTQRAHLKKIYILHKLKLFPLMRIINAIFRVPKIYLNYIKYNFKHKGFNFVPTVNNVIEHISNFTGIDVSKIEIADHHTLHALASMYFIDDKKKYLCFTLDGIGDKTSATVNIWDNNKIKNISRKIGSTLGHMYACIVFLLGMKPVEHEFKVMGMAPYAKDKDVQRVKKVFENFLWIDDNGAFQTKTHFYSFRIYLLDNLLIERFDTICGAMQIFTEEIIMKWIKFWINKTGIKDITLGGGVMMNVKAVKRIYEMEQVNSIFVCPSSGDESLPIGGLFYGNLKLNQTITKMTDLYLGSQNDDDETEKFLKSVSDRYDYQKLSNEEITKIAAQLLAENNVIARCCGREEWGARALGNRSILCDASHYENIDILNQFIKDRDFWMPFTPSILKEDIDKYIVNPRKMSIPYMCITFDSTPLARQHIPAALHPFDHTIRPQAVDKNWNPSYHALLTEFKKITGVSGILNTSLNLHGQPNVSNYKDLIYTLDNSKLKYAIIDSFLVIKKEKGPLTN